MAKRQKFQGREEPFLLSPPSAAFRPAPPGPARTPGQRSPVFHYETDRYRLVTPGLPEDSEMREPGDEGELD